MVIVGKSEVGFWPFVGRLLTSWTRRSTGVIMAGQHPK